MKSSAKLLLLILFLVSYFPAISIAEEANGVAGKDVSGQITDFQKVLYPITEKMGVILTFEIATLTIRPDLARLAEVNIKEPIEIIRLLFPECVVEKDPDRKKVYHVIEKKLLNDASNPLNRIYSVKRNIKTLESLHKCFETSTGWKMDVVSYRLEQVIIPYVFINPANGAKTLREHLYHLDVGKLGVSTTVFIDKNAKRLYVTYPAPLFGDLYPPSGFRYLPSELEVQNSDDPGEIVYSEKGVSAK